MAETKIDIIRGETFPIKVTYKEQNGDAVNLTGYTAHFTIKRKWDRDADDSTAVLKKTWNTHQDAAGGITSTELTADDTLALDPGEYRFDVKVKAANTAVTYLVRGTCVVLDNSTNRTT